MAMELRQCGRCHSKILPKYFSINRKGELRKCCDRCLTKKHQCVQCDYKTGRKCHLNAHIKQVHDKIKDFECPLCDYKCSAKSNLNAHIKHVHDKIKDFECLLCDYKAGQKGHLKTHIKMVHDKIKDHECPDCDYKCSKAGDLKPHIKMVHDKIRDHECPDCDYKTGQKSNLKTHIKVCTGGLNCSSGELGVMKALEKLGYEKDVHYFYDQSYDNVRDKGRLKFDFRLEINGQIIMIEYDGKFHFEPIRMGNMTHAEAVANLKTCQRRDKIKDDYCEEKNIPLLRIPYWEKQNTFELIDAWLTEFI